MTSPLSKLPEVLKSWLLRPDLSISLGQNFSHGLGLDLTRVWPSIAITVSRDAVTRVTQQKNNKILSLWFLFSVEKKNHVKHVTRPEVTQMSYRPKRETSCQSSMSRHDIDASQKNTSGKISQTDGIDAHKPTTVHEIFPKFCAGHFKTKCQNKCGNFEEVLVYGAYAAQKGPSVNNEYLSQIQLYSMFCKLPVMSNTVLIMTVCVKVAKSTFLVKNKRTKWAELSRYYLYNCFVR